MSVFVGYCSKMKFNDFIRHLKHNFPLVYTTNHSIKQLLDLYENEYYTYVEEA